MKNKAVQLLNDLVDFYKCNNKKLYRELTKANEELATYYQEFPFHINDVVYEIMILDKYKRKTCCHGCKQTSFITPCTVTEGNYFYLVHKYKKGLVTLTKRDALFHLDGLCVR